METGFETGSSFAHRLDPRARLLTATAFSLVVALGSRFQALVPAVCGAVLLTALAGLPAGRVARRLLVVNGLILLLWLFLPLTAGGRTWFQVGPFAVAHDGVAYAARITLKSNAIVLVLIAMVSTMPVHTLGRAMTALGAPPKLVHLLLFTYRYTHVIEKEYHRLLTAARIRGFRPGTNVHTYRTVARLLGALLVLGYERGERVRAAMLCRGFQGRYHDLTDFEFRAEDAVVSGFLGLGVGIVAFLEWAPR